MDNYLVEKAKETKASRNFHNVKALKITLGGAKTMHVEKSREDKKGNTAKGLTKADEQNGSGAHNWWITPDKLRSLFSVDEAFTYKGETLLNASLKASKDRKLTERRSPSTSVSVVTREARDVSDEDKKSMQSATDNHEVDAQTKDVNKKELVVEERKSATLLKYETWAKRFKDLNDILSKLPMYEACLGFRIGNSLVIECCSLYTFTIYAQLFWFYRNSFHRVVVSGVSALSPTDLDGLQA